MGIKLIFERNTSTNPGYQEKLHCTYLHHTSLYSCTPHFIVKLYTTRHCTTPHHTSLYTCTPYFYIQFYITLHCTAVHHTSLYSSKPDFHVELCSTGHLSSCPLRPNTTWGVFSVQSPGTPVLIRQFH